MMQWHWIDSDAGLAEVCDETRLGDYVAIDTEFVRTRTYYAQLGLIQLYNGTTLALIDPLAIDDMSPFWELLSDESVIKVLHSGSEDLEIFAQRGGVVPKPLFDSQVAGVLLNLGPAMGYGKLIQHYTDIELDKGESRTDWLARPLRQTQLEYAAADVFYLYQIFPQMHAAIEEMGRLDWVWQEGERACRGRLDPEQPEKAYLKVKNGWQLRPNQLAVLKSLAAWRLEVAQRKDLALGFVVKDAVLLNLAKHAPRSLAYLERLEGLDPRTLQRYGKSMLGAISRADLNNPPEPIDPTALDPDYREAVAEVRVVMQNLAKEHQVQPEFLASKKLVSQYVSYVWRGCEGNLPEILIGWRGELSSDTLSKLSLR
ncbi:ribonuclease D [Ferrimonas lipolytica]|uniref:Ribonuclease D n=1 Tax=Ferrimonas lipolytica TaxID=2724191 RepID=A0A6H1UEH7_9GAMM|nr:ribonuclease D [Ferrimonas lipolytica]QIZ76743.1 ribonuclease D [Ferrimonas lipolytica]